MKKPITYLRISKYRRKYNTEVRKALKNAGINFEEQSKANGYNILVDEVDEGNALDIVLKVPLY